MKIFNLFNLIFVIAFTPISNSSEKNIDSTSIDDIYKQPKFEKWIQFWKSKIPEVENFHVENIYKMKWREPYKINLNKWIESKISRKYTLDYSNNINFVTDEYAYIDFESINDTVYMFGTAVDAYFEVANLKDSVLYHITLHPTCFIGESIWLSDSICCILGFSYDTYGATEYYKGYSKMIIIKMDLYKKTLTQFNSQKLPFSSDYMNYKIYIEYLYPKLKEKI